MSHIPFEKVKYMDKKIGNNKETKIMHLAIIIITVTQQVISKMNKKSASSTNF